MMNKHAKVVIGANYGDEGKGLITDYHVAPAGPDGIVVRFNGGAQAGHTVISPEGKRHVFGHIGSGALAGAATFLSRFFVCHPALFLKETESLQRLGIAFAPVLVDDRALVTTPYDMLINQIIEHSRGNARHGSCGVGFGETIERNLQAQFALSMGDLRQGDGFLLHRLDAIRRRYVRDRLQVLGFADLFEQNRDLIMSDALMEDFVATASCFHSKVSLARPESLRTWKCVVMEGAQGLLLDQDRGYFPYVTRSNTGAMNALIVAQEAGFTSLDLTYVTRAYLTRHGAGPLGNELGRKPFDQVVDATNVPNEFQGSLRFAYLDLDLLKSTIQADFADTGTVPGIKSTFNLAVSCIDQVDDTVAYYADGSLRQATPRGLLEQLQARLAPQTLLASYGPSRSDIREVSRQTLTRSKFWQIELQYAASQEPLKRLVIPRVREGANT